MVLPFCHSKWKTGDQAKCSTRPRMPKPFHTLYDTAIVRIVRIVDPYLYSQRKNTSVHKARCPIQRSTFSDCGTNGEGAVVPTGGIGVGLRVTRDSVRQIVVAFKDDQWWSAWDKKHFAGKPRTQTSDFNPRSNIERHWRTNTAQSDSVFEKSTASMSDQVPPGAD